MAIWQTRSVNNPGKLLYLILKYISLYFYCHPIENAMAIIDKGFHQRIMPLGMIGITGNSFEEDNLI